MPLSISALPPHRASGCATPQRGFSLVEVMIAVLVLAVGVLGAASLQLNALRFNASAAHATQASFIAYNTLDRIRANATNIAGYAGLEVSGCDAAPVAATVLAQDRADFAEAVGCLLPGGTGRVEVVDNRATVTVSWSEARAVAGQENTVSVVSSLIGSAP